MEAGIRVALEMNSNGRVKLFDGGGSEFFTSKHLLFVIKYH